MYYVYVIKSDRFPNKFYTGFTKNTEKRIEDHNSGKSGYAKKFKPWTLCFLAGFKDKQKALLFEKYLKSSSGIAFRNKRLI